MKNNKHIEFFDTTLRDGTQGEGVNVSVEDKIKISKKLDNFGIDIIEGGWPGSNPKDKEFFEKASKLSYKNSKITAFGSTARNLDQIENDKNLNELINAKTKVVTIFGKTWRLHSEKGLGLSEEENHKLIHDSVSFLVKKNKRVIFDAEHFFDGYRDSSDFSLSMIKSAINGGADTVVLCDTNGGSLPHFIYKATSHVKEKFGDEIVIGIHAHNDSGLAAANTLMAVEAGARHVQGTINGVGERCGNVSLATVIPNIILKMGLRPKSSIQLNKLSSLVQFVYDVMNLQPDSQAPFIGKSAFAHKGGIHVSAVMKNSRMYEHIDPNLVGNKQRVLVSDLSGKSNINFKAKELNVNSIANNNISELIVKKIKELEYQGYQYEAAEASLELIFREISGTFSPFFRILDSNVQVSYDDAGRGKADARLKVFVDSEIEHTASDGQGPVDALNKALMKALIRFYPELAVVKLKDYKVRVLNEQAGTSAKVRVIIENTDGKLSWSTVGVSENIIEASRQALSDSLNYKLAVLNEKKTKSN